VFVIRESAPGGSSATTFIWDIFEGDIYLDTNLHFIPDAERKHLISSASASAREGEKRKGNVDSFSELDVAMVVGERAEVLLTFTIDPDMCFHASEDYDDVILKVPLQLDKWDVGAGSMTRKPPQPELKRNANPKAQDRLQTCVQEGTIVVKIPNFAIRTPMLTDRVFVFGYAPADDDRYAKAVIPTSVTTLISIHNFLMANLSTPGLSGSAIIADADGLLVGYLGRKYDGYGCTLATLPRRPWSRVNSPASKYQI
jgi:hypothetical protein